MSSILKVDTIQNTSGTTALTINSDGRVLQPAKPAWRLGMTNNHVISTSGGSGTTINFTSSSASRFDFIQGGCTVSSGEVTVPVAGVYQVNMTLRINGVGSGYIIGRITRNGDVDTTKEMYVINGSPDGTYDNLTGSDCFLCSANDTLRVQVATQSDSDYNVGMDSQFSGFLVG